jgi:hypothetical protein
MLSSKSKKRKKQMKRKKETKHKQNKILKIDKQQQLRRRQKLLGQMEKLALLTVSWQVSKIKLLKSTKIKKLNSSIKE